MWFHFFLFSGGRDMGIACFFFVFLLCFSYVGGMGVSGDYVRVGGGVGGCGWQASFSTILPILHSAAFFQFHFPPCATCAFDRTMFSNVEYSFCIYTGTFVFKFYSMIKSKDETSRL